MIQIIFFLFLLICLLSISELLQLNKRLGDYFASSVILVAFLVCCSLFFLYFNIFTRTMLIASLVPSLIILIIQPSIITNGTTSLVTALKNSPHIVAIMVMSGILLLWTPHWNFFCAGGMDAGNYELYSNHFWKNNSLYFDITNYREKGIPSSWLVFRNSWNSDPSIQNVLRPSYLFGFPAYLAVIKAVIGSEFSSSYGVILLALLTLGLITSTVQHLSGGKLSATLTAICTCLTPIFFYYSKNIMSEALALLGAMSLTYMLCTINDRTYRTTFVVSLCGLFIIFISKLDSYLLLAGFSVGALYLFVSSQDFFKQTLPVLWAAALAGILTAFTNVHLINPSYLKQFSIEAIENITGHPFVVSYSLGFFCLIAILAISSKFKRLISFSQKTETILTNLITWSIIILYVVFIGWNLTLRPYYAPAGITGHDHLNLIRLFWATFPIALAIILLAIPAALLIGNPIKRFTLISFLVVFLYSIYRSHHSPYDIWWMRRYLVPLVTLAAISIGLCSSRSILKSRSLSIAIGALGFSLIPLQVYYMAPFFQHEVNTITRTEINNVLSAIPDSALLIAEQDDNPSLGASINALGNTIRPLRTGPTLLNVPTNQFTRALTLLGTDSAYIISLHNCSKYKRRCRLIFSGSYSHQWSGTRENINSDPKMIISIPIHILKLALKTRKPSKTGQT